MILPQYLQEKLNELMHSVNSIKIKQTREKLTEKYKNKSGTGKTLIDSIDDGLTYALCRMPATYAVLYSLFSVLISQGYFSEIKSISDIGSGTGAGYFALNEFFTNSQINLFERDKNMINIFNKLSNGEQYVNELDISINKPSNKADLIMTSYMLSELSDAQRVIAFKNLLEASNRYVLIVDTGTPKTYLDFMKLIEVATSEDFKVIAPCMAEVCPLKNDYCQFYARVERSHVLRNAKSGTESFEDEKYFYLLFEKVEQSNNVDGDNVRVIRRPVYKPNMVELTLCTTGGVKRKIFTKKDKDQYKQAKKSKINGLL